MGQIIDVVERFFADEDWDVSSTAEDESVRLANYEGENGSWSVVAIGVEEHQQVLIYSICPTIVGPDRIEAATAFLHRVNWGLHVGNFELDLDDGEIRFKTSNLVDSTTFVAPHVQALVYWNCMMMDVHLPALNLLVQQGLGVEEALKELEETIEVVDDNELMAMTEAE